MSIPWQLVAVSGRSLTISYTTAGCESSPHLSVAETSRRVTVGVDVRVPAGPAICPAVAFQHRATVALRRPLGRRRLVHARVTR